MLCLSDTYAYTLFSLTVNTNVSTCVHCSVLDFLFFFGKTYFTRKLNKCLSMIVFFLFFLLFL